MDARPLIEPVDRATARAYVRQLRASGRMPATQTAAVILAVVVGAFFLVVFGSVFAGICGSFLRFATTGGSPLFAVVPVLILVIVLAVGGFAVWGYLTGKTGSVRTYRLDRFAQANGMRWYAERANPPLPGLIFSRGHDRKATDILRAERPRFVEFANYRYETGSGKNETTHNWSYVAMKLTSPLPNIVLDATGNNSFLGSNLPQTFDRSQRLHLEGDFDTHFALYCPAGYERDALYLFTPDIMARFIDHAAELDVEIVDDWLFLYSRRPLVGTDPQTWAWLFGTVAALTQKFAQWERWRDERLAEVPPAPRFGSTAADFAAAQPGLEASAAPLPFSAPATPTFSPPPLGVAPQGRRLKKGVPWATVIVFAVFIGAWIVSQFGMFQSMFGR